MASYRPFPPPPPQSTFVTPPNQNPIPPPPQSRVGASQYTQNWGYNGADPSSQNYNTQFQPGGAGAGAGAAGYPSRNQYPYPPPPPPDSAAYPPPPPPSNSKNPANLPPPPMYYPSSQFSQFNHPPLQPPPPSSPPPTSSIPPPPPSPPPQPPSLPVNHSKETRPVAETKQHKPSIPPRKPNLPSGRTETEEERRQRKKREAEKQRLEEKHRMQLKQSQNKVLQKTQQMLSSGGKGIGSISGSHMGERRTATLLNADRTENRLKKPTTFVCKLRFRNELPDSAGQPKLTSLGRDRERYTKYNITSLEKIHKPQLYVESDLGVPLDLLDLSVYNPPKGVRLQLDPEDEDLLREDVALTPIKKDGLKRKERPTDQGFSWLVKTQYISPLTTDATKQALTDKQAKELREKRGGRILANFNNRDKKIKEIEASFEACKSVPVHATNKSLKPVEIFPLLPDLDRYEDQFVMATFDNAPTADSELYGKLDKSVRDAYESQALMKSFVSTGSDAKPDKFLAYMAPSLDELSKDMYDEQEDISYTWIREYHWDVRGDDADDPTTYLVAFGEKVARYVPLPTKLILRKKRAKEGRSSNEIEHYPAPSSVTVRRRSTVAAIELKDPENFSSRKGNSRSSGMEDGHGRRQKGGLEDGDMDQSSGGEYDASD